MGLFITLGGFTAIAWIVVWLDARDRRIERAARAARTGTPSQDPSKRPA
jgi:hypothetical protein